MLFVFLQFGHYLFQTLFKLAAIFGTGDNQRKIERKDAFVFEKAGNCPVNDLLRQPFDDRGFADAGFAYENRIIFCPAAENFDKAFDLRLASDERIQLALRGVFGQIACEFVQIRRL